MLNSPLEQFNIISMCGVKPPVFDGIFILGDRQVAFSFGIVERTAEVLTLPRRESAAREGTWGNIACVKCEHKGTSSHESGAREYLLDCLSGHRDVTRGSLCLQITTNRTTLILLDRKPRVG